jgi:hypothetical protein
VRFRLLLGVLPLLLAACQREGTSVPAAADKAATPAQAATPASVPPAVKPPDALASQNTNWTGLVADVMEFRRKGHTLTALVRIRSLNEGTTVLNSNFSASYVLDESGGKKYEVLKDETGGYIVSAGGTTGLTSGSSMMIWMKFPAPPSDVKKATLTVPETPPFEDLTIQASAGSVLVIDPAPWAPAVQAAAEKAVVRLGAKPGLEVRATILESPAPVQP